MFRGLGGPGGPEIFIHFGEAGYFGRKGRLLPIKIGIIQSTINHVSKSKSSGGLRSSCEEAASA
jgi:hypothetical protein